MAMPRSTRETYDAVAVTLHWSTAVLIAALWISGTVNDAVPSSSRLLFLQLHMTGGLIVFALVLVRLIWRHIAGVPDPIEAGPRWLDKLAQVSHAALYALMFATPVLGLLTTLNRGRGIDLIGLPALLERNRELARMFVELHELAANALLAVAFAHAAAALWHHYGRRDPTLTRMMPWLRSRT